MSNSEGPRKVKKWASKAVVGKVRPDGAEEGKGQNMMSPNNVHSENISNEANSMASI